MEELTTEINQHKWLLNNGLVTSFMQNNLYTFGYLCCQGVQAAHVEIDTQNKKVLYTLYMTPKFLSIISKFEAVRTSKTLWGLWRTKRMLKKYGNLDARSVLQRYAGQLCGDKWTVEVKVADIATYVEKTAE